MLKYEPTDIIAAIKNDNPPLLTAILLANVSPNFKYQEKSTGYYRITPLICAIIEDNQEAVDILLKYGANIDGLDDNGYSPLAHACVNADMNIATKLLDAGCDIEKNVAGWSPLMVSRGRCTQLLIDRGANVHVRTLVGSTPLINAVRHNDLVKLSALLIAGIDIHALDNQQRNALIDAGINGCTDFIQPLVDAGADIWHQDMHNRNVFDYAKEYGHLEFIDNLNAYIESLKMNQLICESEDGHNNRFSF